LKAPQHASFRPRFKHTIEAHLWESGLKATVIRPAGFMENLLMPTTGIGEGKFYHFMPQGKVAPYITTEDIGIFAGVIFQNPAQFIGKTLNIAGDKLDVDGILEALESSLGKQIELVQLPKEFLAAQNPMFAQLIDVQANAPYPEIDLQEMRALNPRLRTLKMWLEEFVKAKLLKS
jgi:uncharacterized protein YbjT (DUF2867 family)